MPGPLDDSVQYLKGVGPARARDFARLGVNTVQDLLFTFPRDLSDRTSIRTIADCGAEASEPVSLLVKVAAVKEKKARRGRMTITVAECSDGTGSMEAVWFNSPWLGEKLAGNSLLLFGKPRFEYGRLRMEHPQHEVLSEGGLDDALHIGRIVPIYPCTGRLSQNIWRAVMTHALETRLAALEELYPGEFLGERGFVSRQEAVRNMHFPESPQGRARAQERLVYDESLLMQLGICLRRHHARHDRPGRRFRITPELDARIRKLFPFRLTSAQDRCIAEIRRDMESELPMHRLLQGDVGSGKTVVALYAMLAAVANKAQVCIMAPTGLLARQHQATIAAFLANSRQASVKVGLLPGGLAKGERDGLLARLRSGAIDMLVSTHAAIEADIAFRDLGLIVIDEQHKFGVRQRAALAGKAVQADTLVMTATPIPRSLALTVYGDLDVSLIDELPPGRKPVRTVIVSPARENEIWRFLRQELTKGRQAYVVSPLVEENEELDLKSATQALAELGQGPLCGFRLDLLHGRMKREEQREIMERFRGGATDVLVSTVVIEVGVDIPNANLMVVLHAERFGLAQLHQLRGRIGRGSEHGHFLLLSERRTPEARQRLGILARSSDGFRIAEEDLRLRGPGEFLGTRQHGLPDLKVVDIARDLATIRAARGDAQRILRADPGLTQKSHLPIRRELQRLLGPEGLAGIG